MLIEIVVGGLITAFETVTGEILKKQLRQVLDERALKQNLTEAVKWAEHKFNREYSLQDAELTQALLTQTKLTQLPSVKAALITMAKHPFDDPGEPLSVVVNGFSDVLPSYMDRSRVDAGVNAFLHYLAQEIMYIPQLQSLYTLYFQKSAAESGKATAHNTAQLVRGISQMQAGIAQLPSASTSLALPGAITITTGANNNVERGGAANFQRLKPWHNLPQRNYTDFVGREEQIKTLENLMLPHPRSRHFLVTIDGIGGVGKSTLALRLAYYYRDNYDTLPPQERFEAIIWVSAKRTVLTAGGIEPREQTFSNLNDLYRAIASVLEQPQVLQANFDQRRGLTEQVLIDKRTLLIVDNLETVDDERLVQFLRELPDPTKAIITTRHRVDVAYAMRLTGLPEEEAMRLIELEAADKNLKIPQDKAQELFVRTGGIPLAIEWSIGLVALDYNLDTVLRRLRSGHNHITQFCFEESVGTIKGEDAYIVLLSLALFDSIVSRKTLGAVAGLEGDQVGTDEAIARLLQLSLVNHENGRISILPLTQTFASEELAKQPALEQELRERWVAYLVKLAKSHEVLHWQWQNLEQLQAEGKHLVTLANWGQQSGQLQVLLEVIPALVYYFDLTGEWAEGLAFAQKGLENARLTGDHKNSLFILQYFGWILSQQGQHQQAEQNMQEALVLATQLGADSTSRLFTILTRYSQVKRRQGDYEGAIKHCQAAWELIPLLPISEKIYHEAELEYELGKIARDQGDWRTAQALLQKAQQVFRNDVTEPLFNPERAWGLLGNLAYVSQMLGDTDTAFQLQLQTLEYFQVTGTRSSLVTTLVRLALLEEQRGNPKEAILYANQASEYVGEMNLDLEKRQLDELYKRLGIVL